MKILHVLECFDKVSGGPPPVVTGMCAALHRRGHEVSLFAGRSSEPFLLPSAAPYNLRLFDMNFRPYAFSWSMMRALKREIPHFDIVHIHMVYRFPQAAAAHFSRRNGVPHCIQPHGALVAHLYNRSQRGFFRRLYGNTVERRNIRNATAAIFTAVKERENARVLGFSPRRSFIVPVGADVADLAVREDPAPFRERYGLQGKEVLLWMGRIVEKKALDVLVAAFERIAARRPAAMLVLAGPDTEGYEIKVREWVAQAGLNDKVVFTGMINGAQKRQAYCVADLFVFPSYAENFGVVLLEAMAAGVPAILSRGIDIWEEIQACGAGIATDSDPEQVASAALALLSDPSRRSAMSEAAKKAAWEYDWSQIAEVLEKAYRSITG